MENLDNNIKKSSKAGMSIGASSILIIFIIVCLVTFAVLSLVSAGADYRLSQKVAERNQSYYNATSAAQEKLRDLSREPRDFAELKEFDQPINDSQVIHVTVMLPATGSGEDISIISWQVEKNSQK